MKPRIMEARFEELRARDVMQLPVAVEGRAALVVAARRMWRTGAETLLVLADDGALIGLLSERDLVFGAEAAAQGLAGTVADHASRGYLHVRPDDLLVEVIERMAAGAVRLAVVIGRDGEPVGIISLFGQLRVPGEDIAGLEDGPPGDLVELVDMP